MNEVEEHATSPTNTEQTQVADKGEIQNKALGKKRKAVEFSRITGQLQRDDFYLEGIYLEISPVRTS